MMEVYGSPSHDQIGAAVRQGVLIVGSLVAGNGAAHGDTLPVVAGVVGALASLLYGQWRTRKRAKQLATLASAVPDAIATIK